MLSERSYLNSYLESQTYIRTGDTYHNLLACMSRKDISNLIIFDFLRYILWSFFISLSIKKSIFLGGNVCNGRYHWGKKFLSMHIHTNIFEEKWLSCSSKYIFLEKKNIKKFSRVENHQKKKNHPLYQVQLWIMSIPLLDQELLVSMFIQFIHSTTYKK